GRLLLGEPAAGLAGLAGAVHRARLAGRGLHRARLRLPRRPRPQPGAGRPGHGRDPRDHRRRDGGADFLMAGLTPLTLPAPVTLAEFDALFERVKNWGRWGPDDELGTLNYLTPSCVQAAAALVRSGRHVTMAIPMNTVAGPDNPSPVTHHVVTGHDIDIGSGSLTFATDYLGLAFHGDCHTHMDALCHIAYRGQVYNGGAALEVMTTRGATALDVTSYANGLVARRVLLDIPRLRGGKA